MPTVRTRKQQNKHEEEVAAVEATSKPKKKNTKKAVAEPIALEQKCYIPDRVQADSGRAFFRNKFGEERSYPFENRILDIDEDRKWYDENIDLFVNDGYIPRSQQTKDVVLKLEPKVYKLLHPDHSEGNTIQGAFTTNIGPRGRTYNCIDGVIKVDNGDDKDAFLSQGFVLVSE